MKYKYLTRSNDTELKLWTVEKAKEYLVEKSLFKDCDTLEEIAQVWNANTDDMFDGSSLIVKEI